MKRFLKEIAVYITPPHKQGFSGMYVKWAELKMKAFQIVQE